MPGSLSSQTASLPGGGTFPFGMFDASGVGSGPWYNVHLTLGADGATLVDPATEETQAAVLDALNQIVTGTVLPTNAATASAQASAQSTLSSILTVLQAQRSDTLWTDDSETYYVRVDKAGAVSWTDLSGAASTAPGAGARPADGTSIALERMNFKATAAGSGFAVGDYLVQVVSANPATGAVLGHFWLNITQNSVLATPPASASISPISALPTNAATASAQASILAALQNIGTTTDAAVTDASTAASLIAATKGVLSRLAGTLGVTMADGANTTLGAKVDAAYAGAGASSIVAILKGIYTATLAALPAGTAIIGKVGIDTAANGVAIADGGAVTLGAKADAAATTGSGSGSVVAWLRGIFNAVTGTLATSVADGGNVTMGLKADAAYTGAGAASAIAALKGIYTATLAALPAGTAIIGKVGIDATANTVGIADGGAVTIGAKADAAATTGAVSLIALIKGLLGFYVGAVPTSRTIAASVASTSTSFFAANAARRKWFLQAPQTAGLWINPLGGTAGPSLADCIYVQPGGTAQSSASAVETSAITYWCGTANLVIPAYEI